MDDKKKVVLTNLCNYEITVSIPELHFTRKFPRKGAKISVDSATMMNKGFELIESHWFFEVDPEDIETLEEVVMAAVNEAIRMQTEDEKEQMGKITGGGGLPF